MVVTLFCNRVSTIWFVLSNFRIAAMADLRSCCGSDLIVFVLFRAIAAGDTASKSKSREKRKMVNDLRFYRCCNWLAMAKIRTILSISKKTCVGHCKFVPQLIFRGNLFLQGSCQTNLFLKQSEQSSAGPKKNFGWGAKNN